jgi:3-oxoacyl-[acyl-carrier-protein] synthase-3
MFFFPSTACILQHKIGARNAWGFDSPSVAAVSAYAPRPRLSSFTGARTQCAGGGRGCQTSILNPNDRSTYVLFGDGAGAVLVEATEPGEHGILDFVLRSDGSGGKYLMMPGGGSLNPSNHETVDKKMHFVHQDGRAVFKCAIPGMAEVSMEILKRNNICVTELALYVPHQANSRIVSAAVDKIGIERE